MPMTKQRLDIPLQLKSVSDSGEFEGYGSVFGVKDSYDDVVVPGAFSASLQAWKEKNALPALLWQHRMDEPIGIYTEMKEDEVGLYVKGRLAEFLAGSDKPVLWLLMAKFDIQPFQLVIQVNVRIQALPCFVILVV